MSIKIVFNDENTTELTVEDGVSYSAQTLIPLIEAQVEDENVLSTFKYNVDSCERGEKSMLVDFQSTSVFAESITDGDVIGFAGVHKSG